MQDNSPLSNVSAGQQAAEVRRTRRDKTPCSDSVKVDPAMFDSVIFLGVRGAQRVCRGSEHPPRREEAEVHQGRRTGLDGQALRSRRGAASNGRSR